MQSTTNIAPKFKSEMLTKKEQAKFAAIISSNKSLSKVAHILGVPRYVIDRVRLTGSASPENISIIRSNLNN